MKRLSSCIAGIFLASCLSTAFAQNQDTIKVVPVRPTVSHVKEMTCRTFIKEVYDYRRKSTPWLFKGSKPACIVLYANWCSPCREMAPIIENLAIEYNDSVKFYKVNIDNEKAITDYFKASYIPFFVLIPLFDEPQKFSGTMDKETFRKKIEEVLFDR